MIALLTLYPALDLARVRARVRELAAMADTPEVVAGFESAITDFAKAVQPRRARVPKKPAPRANKVTVRPTILPLGSEFGDRARPAWHIEVSGPSTRRAAS